MAFDWLDDAKRQTLTTTLEQFGRGNLVSDEKTATAANKVASNRVSTGRETSLRSALTDVGVSADRTDDMMNQAAYSAWRGSLQFPGLLEGAQVTTASNDEDAAVSSGSSSESSQDRPSSINTDDTFDTAETVKDGLLEAVTDDSAEIVADNAWSDFTSDTVIDGEIYDVGSGTLDDVYDAAGAAEAFDNVFTSESMTELADSANLFANASSETLAQADTIYTTVYDNAIAAGNSSEVAGTLAQEAYNSHLAANAEGTTILSKITGAVGDVATAVGKALPWIGFGTGVYQMATEWDDMDSANRTATAAGTTASAAAIASQLAESAAASSALGAASGIVGLFALGVSAANIASATRDPDGMDISHPYPSNAVVLDDGRILFATNFTKDSENVPQLGEKSTATDWKEYAVDSSGAIIQNGSYESSADFGESGGQMSTVYDPNTNQFYNVDLNAISNFLYGADTLQSSYEMAQNADKYYSTSETQDSLWNYLNNSSDWYTPMELGIYNDKVLTNLDSPFPFTLDDYQQSIVTITDSLDWGDEWVSAFIAGDGNWSASSGSDSLSFTTADELGSLVSSTDEYDSFVASNTDDNGYDGPTYDEYTNNEPYEAPGFNGYYDEEGNFIYWGPFGEGG